MKWNMKNVYLMNFIFMNIFGSYRKTKETTKNHVYNDSFINHLSCVETSISLSFRCVLNLKLDNAFKM